MMDNSVVKLCIICGVKEEAPFGPLFSKDVKLGKFCGELELRSGGGLGDGEFAAFNFLQQLDKCSEFVKICEGCSGLISEAVDKRGELEEKECQVLELQIKLLVKLKEMEGCSQLYLGEMGRIMEKVKGSQVDGLERNKGVFGRERSKLNVLGFRERILNVGTSLAIFQDKLTNKLVEKGVPVEVPVEEEEGPCSPIYSGPNFNCMEDNDDIQYDKMSLSPGMSSPEPEVDDFNDNIDKGQTLKKIKQEQPDSPKDNFNSKETDKPPKTTKVPTKPKRKRSDTKLWRYKLSQVNWSEMGPLKTNLVKYILKHPKIVKCDKLLSTYKWTYTIPTDQIQFANYTIKVTELIGKESGLTLSCSDNHLENQDFQISQNFPPNLNQKELGKRLYFLKEKVRDHVLSFHLNAFNCPKCPKAVKKLNSLKIFRKHLNSHHGSMKSCEICGRTFSRLSNLKRHQLIHLDKGKGVVGDGDEEGDGEGVKLFQCSVCGKGFSSKNRCNIHEEQHKPKEERVKVTCSFCGKTVLERCYSIHKKYSCPVQSRVEAMTCEICGKSYKNGKSLGDHLVRTHRVPERPRFL